MSVDVDFLPHLIMKDNLLNTQYDRRNRRANSISSSSSSSTTPNTSSSWLERKLFSHFKRFFRRKSLSLASNSSTSSHRASSSGEEVISLPADEEPHEESEDEKPFENENDTNIESPVILPIETKSTTVRPPVDTLLDYDRLLARCTQQQEQDRSEMILRCHKQISIPHADLLVNQVCTTVLNWKSYVRLFNGLKRDPHLFQQYIEQYFSCRSFVNHREQLIFRCRTTKNIFDNVLRKFLDEYVTCLMCQTAQTYLMKTVGFWKIECQLCATQRTVKRLTSEKMINSTHTNDSRLISVVPRPSTQKKKKPNKPSDI